MLGRAFGNTHYIWVWKLCPSMFGFPMKRVRKISICVSRSKCLADVAIPRSPVDLFGARAVTMGSIYFLQDGPGIEGIMGVGDWGRLRKHIEKMVEAGISDGNDYIINATRLSEAMSCDVNYVAVAG